MKHIVAILILLLAMCSVSFAQSSDVPIPRPKPNTEEVPQTNEMPPYFQSVFPGWCFRLKEGTNLYDRLLSDGYAELYRSREMVFMYKPSKGYYVLLFAIYQGDRQVALCVVKKGKGIIPGENA